MTIGCMGCGRRVKCTQSIKYSTYWFCDAKCVEMRRGYLVKYISQGLVADVNNYLDILDQLLEESGSLTSSHQSDEFESSFSSIDGSPVSDSEIMPKTVISS